jgi:hypothetical protein
MRMSNVRIAFRGVRFQRHHFKGFANELDFKPAKFDAAELNGRRDDRDQVRLQLKSAEFRFEGPQFAKDFLDVWNRSGGRHRPCQWIDFPQ